MPGVLLQREEEEEQEGQSNILVEFIFMILDCPEQSNNQGEEDGGHSLGSCLACT